MGIVGPSSVPFDRCTSILTRPRTLLVVFSTVPLEGIACSVVLQDQSGAATNCIEGLIRRQHIRAAAFFATGFGGFTTTLITAFTGALFTADFTTFSTCVSYRAGAGAVKHFQVNDVSIVGYPGKIRLTGNRQACPCFLSRVQVSQLLRTKLPNRRRPDFR